MLLLVVATVMVMVVLAVISSRLTRRGNANDMGRMSDQWLVEHRASHPNSRHV